MPDGPPAYVRPDVRAFLDYANALPGPRLYEMTAPEARAKAAQGRDLLDLPTGGLALTKDLTIPAPAASIPVRLYDAQAHRPPGPVVVYFHGGGFVLGDLDMYDPLCAEIARTLDVPVVSVGYRLAPEHRWPAAPLDCEAAARWVAEGHAELGRGVTGLVLAGDSAGGKLAIITAVALRDQPAAAPVLAQFPIYPTLGKAHQTESFLEFSQGYFLGADEMRWFTDAYGADPTDWRGNPSHKGWHGLPPALVLTAGLDPLRDEGRNYAAALIHEGIATIFREAVGNIHGFCNMRRAIPSSVGDLAGALAALKPLIVEAEAARAMAAAATETET